MTEKKRDPSTWTKPRQFRLTDATLSELDWLRQHYGGLSRSDVLRMLIRKAAQQEGYVVALEESTKSRRGKKKESQE